MNRYSELHNEQAPLGTGWGEWLPPWSVAGAVVTWPVLCDRSLLFAAPGVKTAEAIPPCRDDLRSCRAGREVCVLKLLPSDAPVPIVWKLLTTPWLRGLGIQLLTRRHLCCLAYTYIYIYIYI